MKTKFYNMFKRYSFFLITATLLASCALTNSVKNGSLKEGVYSSSTDEFSFFVPKNAIVQDGKHPLGGFVSVRQLADPMIEKGIAYNRVALPKDKLTLKEAKGIIKSGSGYWLKGYALRDPENIIHEEWIDIDGTPLYFTVIEGASSGLLVKPGSYTGTISFLRGNYSYVLYEIVDAPYQLKGSDDSPETINVKKAETRLSSIRRYLKSVKFTENKGIRFPLDPSMQ